MGKAMSDAPAAVSVLTVSRVVPALAPAEPVKVKLSFLDAPWAATPLIQHVYLYKLAGGDDEYPAAVMRLKASLATVLALYLPLAGELRYMPDTGDLVVDCSDAGVSFVEAEAKGSRMDVVRLTGDEAHDVPAFQSLVPKHDARVLPAPIMLLQATRLHGAGLALGTSVHHTVADGRAMTLFLHAWASASRGGSPVTSKFLGPPPEYGREAVARAHPFGDELARVLLKKVAPDLPVANSKVDYFNQQSRMARRTFFVAADDVRLLKRRIDRLASAGGELPKPAVSTFVALLALGWTGIVRAKGLSAGEDAYLTFYADLRARLHPPVSAGYFGNCITGCLARAEAGELIGEVGLLHASRAVLAAVRELEAAPLVGTERWVERAARLPPARVTRVAGYRSPLLRAYEAANFGFGRPGLIEPMSMNYDGSIVLRGGRRDGEVQVSVVLQPVHMDAFKLHINGSLRPRI